MRAQIHFHGAAREVTGSMHLIEANGSKIALDCGLHQGRRAESNAKNRSFPCAPADLHAVILSHAHIDHCGKLPLLIKRGFQGRIYATAPTCDLAEILLADAAHIQEEDAFYWNKKRVKRGDDPIEPLYTQEDVDQTMPLFTRTRLQQTFEAAPGIRVTLHEAGHMLGSASVHVAIDQSPQESVSLTYTGDVGRPGMAILRDPAPLPPCDYLLCESTYGGRETDQPEPMRDRLAKIINWSAERKGKIIIPAFAVGRTQAMVYHFHQLMRDKRIPPMPVIVDSPLAVRATEIFRNHPEVYDAEATALHRATHGDMLDCDGCEYIQNVEQSKALHGRPGPMIILSASGMCEVGRILHHLKNNLENPQSTVLIVGYQAAHTLGRRLVEGQKRVKIFGEMYDVKARVKVFNGFSAHADADELVKMTTPLKDRVKTVFLVHGEEQQCEALRQQMRTGGFANVQIPESGQVVALT